MADPDSLQAPVAHGDLPQLPSLSPRFRLKVLRATGVLADCYWVDDMQTAGATRLATLLLVKPNLASLADFDLRWQQTLAGPMVAVNAYPDILAYGHDQDRYWLVCQTDSHKLVSEGLAELDEHGLTQDDAFQQLEKLVDSLNSVQAGAFGYVDPANILQREQDYQFLNAPLVRILQILMTPQHGQRPSLALHSAWLSPSIAVGDLPQTEDDTFSVATLLYAWLTKRLPYEQQSTLAAAAHGKKPPTISKLNSVNQQVLQQALALQADQRPENPEILLTALRGKGKPVRNKWLPMALLTATGVMAYTGYHLVGQMDQIFTRTPSSLARSPVIEYPPSAPLGTDLNPITEQAAQADEQPTSNPVELVNETELKPATSTTSGNSVSTATDTAVAPLNPRPETTSEAAVAIPTPTTKASTESTDTPKNSEIPNSTKIEPVTSDTGSATDRAKAEQITTWLTEAENIMQKNATSDDALALLRQAWQADNLNPRTKGLLNRLLASRINQTETRIRANQFADAKSLLAENDQLIREFVLMDHIQKQVNLEEMLDTQQRQQADIARLLKQAHHALERERLTSSDRSNDNALSYATQILNLQPNHAQGKQVVQDIVIRRHAQINRLLSENRLTQANRQLNELQGLISRYGLNTVRTTQANLRQRYRNLQENAATERARAAKEAALRVQQTRQAQQEQQASPANPAMAESAPEGMILVPNPNSELPDTSLPLDPSFTIQELPLPANVASPEPPTVQEQPLQAAIPETETTMTPPPEAPNPAPTEPQSESQFVQPEPPTLTQPQQPEVIYANPEPTIQPIQADPSLPVPPQLSQPPEIVQPEQLEQTVEQAVLEALPLIELDENGQPIPETTSIPQPIDDQNLPMQ